MKERNFKACPFCGSKDIWTAMVVGFKTVVGCNNCGVRTREFDRIWEAEAAWNRRAGRKSEDVGTDADDGIQSVRDIIGNVDSYGDMPMPPEQTPF